MTPVMFRLFGKRCVTTLKSFGRTDAPLLLTLGDREPAVAAALRDAFADVDAVEVVEGDLLAVRADAVVSPANSFGDMGGGIDKAIDDQSHGEAQRRLRAAIAEQWLGELPVGAALVVPVPAGRFRFVVTAPTMRVPGSVIGTINGYLSLRAALVAVARHNAAATGSLTIRRMVVAGLGTGVGGLPAGEAAGQMRVAYDNIIGGGWRTAVHPALAPFALGRRSV